MRFQDSKSEAKQWRQQLTMTKWMRTLEAWSRHCLPRMHDYHQIMEAQEGDPARRQIKVYCCEDWPDKHSLNDAMKPHWSSRGELYVVQNILLKASRIVIPSSMRHEILDKIHEGHLGVTKCRERVKNSRIQDQLVQQCRVCAHQTDNRPEPLITTPLTDCPWQIVATDLFELKGVDYTLLS